MTRFAQIAAAIAVVASAACSYPPAGASGNRLVLASQGHFFVGGEYTKTKDGQIRAGQMYVQFQVPANRTQAYPVVMWHGGNQTGTNFTGTPDGRSGWADEFLQRGYAVYVVDQPGRARSGYFGEAYGPTRRPDAASMQLRFTAPERANLYPQARLHTQWPGTGTAGDEIFDQFFSSQVEDMQDLALMERLNRDAGIALLERIGAAILLTHSQSGPFGWALADARPSLVKGILAIEPNGPPFYENTVVGPPDWFRDGAVGRTWGITRNALTFSPAVTDANALKRARQVSSTGAALVRCWLPVSPAPQLPNLRGIPILIVTGEASYHAPYDHCTAAFLEQAGVTTAFVRLADVGIRGNGHMMMLEKNNLEIAAFLDDWVREHVN